MSKIKSDIEIARAAKIKPIEDVLAKVNVPNDHFAFRIRDRTHLLRGGRLSDVWVALVPGRLRPLHVRHDSRVPRPPPGPVVRAAYSEGPAIYKP